VSKADFEANTADIASVGKRELILDTALDLFVQKGYLDTKIIDIANAAGIGKGTIYEYFSSKEELFAELLQTHVLEPYSGMEEEITSGNVPCSEQIKRYILFDTRMAKRFGNGKNFIDQLFDESLMSQCPDLKKILRRLMHYRLSTLSSIIERGIERGEFAPVDSRSAAFSIMGAIAAFISYRCELFSEWRPTDPDSNEEGDPLATGEPLLGLLLYGLSSQDVESD
jgi:AcrR family transcriptional regulator